MKRTNLALSILTIVFSLVSAFYSCQTIRQIKALRTNEPGCYQGFDGDGFYVKVECSEMGKP